MIEEFTENDNVFVSEIKSLARELNINTNVVYSYWREGKYTTEEKNRAIKKLYKKFLKEITRLLKEQEGLPELVQSPKDEPNFYGKKDGE